MEKDERKGRRVNWKGRMREEKKIELLSLRNASITDSHIQIDQRATTQDSTVKQTAQMCTSAVYYMSMLYLHNVIFHTDIIGCDRLK